MRIKFLNKRKTCSDFIIASFVAEEGKVTNVFIDGKCWQICGRTTAQIELLGLDGRSVCVLIILRERRDLHFAFPWSPNGITLLRQLLCGQLEFNYCIFLLLWRCAGLEIKVREDFVIGFGCYLGIGECGLS